MSRASEDLLSKLHNVVAEQLLARIASGEAKPADFTAAIKFLADNGINCDVGSSPAIGGLKEELDKLLTTQFAGKPTHLQ
jgi:hypothetical protein